MWNVRALLAAKDVLTLTNRQVDVDMGASVQLTAEQRMVFDAAVAVLRNRYNLNEDQLSEGRAVELFAAQFLNG